MNKWEKKIASERDQPRKAIGFYFTILTGEMAVDGTLWPILRRVNDLEEARKEASQELKAGKDLDSTMVGCLKVYDDGSVEHEEFCPTDLEDDEPLPEEADSYVPAEAHSDDKIYEVKFDAAPWLAKATDEEVQALAACGWGGDYAADEVAHASAAWEPELKKLFTYIEKLANRKSHKDLCGFECEVNEEAAMEWLELRRPELFKRLKDQLETG